MLVEWNTLKKDLAELATHPVSEVVEALAALGFPVDGQETLDGTTVLDVDITANRGDAMSHRGLARDLAARLEAELVPIPCHPLTEGAPLRPIRLESVACPLYATAILELGSGAGTPEAVRQFLAAMGTQAKGLAAVDASNELLFRYGHPTHAFDLETLVGDIRVRWAQDGEVLRTLDGLDRRLTIQDLVIADDSGPIALAGVMGGDRTKVTEATRTVLLESAYFDPRTVRAMARRHGLHTDASHRFGRGADPAMALMARTLLAYRLMDWAGATLQSAWSVGHVPASGGPIALRREVLARIAGEELRMADAAQALKRLGCQVHSEPGTLQVQPPTWRHDLGIEEDLAEEVLRIRGYDRIPVALPPLEGAPHPHTESYAKRRAVARRLAHLGFFQTVTLGFTSPEADAKGLGADGVAQNPIEGRTLGNPLSAEYAVMRASLLPSLGAAAEHNRRQGAKEVRLFELAPTFRSHSGGPQEVATLAMVWGGRLGGEDYLSPSRSIQVADLIGVARDLGVQGPLDVRDLEDGLLGLELPLDAIPEQPSRIIPTFRMFSRFPVVERDLSLLVALDQSYAGLIEAIQRALPADMLVDLRCVDVFRHKSLPAGQQAWLLRFRFQSDARTLTGAEVDAWMAAALESAEALGATLRA